MKKWLKRLTRRMGFEVEYVGRRGKSVALPSGEGVRAYVENPETGPMNLREKLARVKSGEPFEWPNIVALNEVVAGLLGPVGRVVELGGGTGSFVECAWRTPGREIVSSELDGPTHRWVGENRPHPNVKYIDRLPTPADGPFDVVVAVEVVEHVADFAAFLRLCTQLAPRAIITTPNRRRGPRFDTPGPPAVAKHVREWTAGEFYWVLRCFYPEVRLFAMPNPYVPEGVAIDVTSELTPVIADCTMPTGRSNE